MAEEILVSQLLLKYEKTADCFASRGRGCGSI